MGLSLCFFVVTANPAGKKPNMIVLMTDQQRSPMHWPSGQWLRELCPADAEIARTGLTFESMRANTSMCSPVRATFLTGQMPARHGVPLTLTHGGAPANPQHLPGIVATAAKARRRDDVPIRALMSGARRQLWRPGWTGGAEPELRPGIPTLGTVLGAAGYHVGFRGKWHLTKPLDPEAGWGPADSERIEADYGLRGWVPPDAGEDILPEHFGGGDAGTLGTGWDDDYTRQSLEFLANPPEPFCLFISLVNPHDVLAYPTSWQVGGYGPEDIADIGVSLPPTIDESLASKPLVHAMMAIGMASIIGPLRSDADRLAYVNFYAKLHSVIDRHIGRIVSALGDPDDPASLRSRTVLVRTADHGEMGLSHGGLRQKAFNAYEETLRVPLVISNPLLFPNPRTTAAPAGSIDILPTLASLAGADASHSDGFDLVPEIARNADPDGEALDRAAWDADGVLARSDGPAPPSAQLFTYDDHQAGTAISNVSGQPTRVRCVIEDGWKWAIYIDPSGREPSNQELYDLRSDPLEENNLVGRHGDRRTGPEAAEAHARLRDRLCRLIEATGGGWEIPHIRNAPGAK
jgi:arylsulfatase A-like enzyme